MADHFRGPLRAVCVFSVLAALTCALFAAAASTLVAMGVACGWLAQPSGLALRMAIKALVFAVLAALALAGLWKLRRAAPEHKPVPRPLPLLWPHYVLVVALIVAACGVLFPRLDSYPYPEPDELHHLIVARNLGMFGQYASGHAETGFIQFDPYDSVGAPVILPVAASLKLGGATLAAGRLPVALCFLLLLVLTVLLFVPTVGAPAALLGGIFLLAAWGSIYLGRTVYGEVPALTFFVAGLLCWRRSLRAKPWLFAFIAGLGLGLATLSKSILLLTAFPFAAVVLHDWWNRRQLRLPHVIMPMVGVVAAQAAWMILKALDGDQGLAGSTMGLYQHYLMFGFGGLSPAMHWIASNQAMFLLAALAGLAILAPALTAQRDPAALVAMLSAVLYLFWWCFFTDAHIPRYLWFSIALLSFPVANLLWRLARQAATHPRRMSRIVGVTLIIVLCTPYGSLVRYEIDRIYGPFELGKDERDVMAYVAGLPKDTHLATTWWPLERWANFFLNRPMPVVEDIYDALGSKDVIVSRGYPDADRLNPPSGTRRIGAYVIYRKEP